MLAVLAVGCSLPSKFNVGSYVNADAGLDASGPGGSGDGAVGQAGNGSGGHAGSGVGGTAGWGNADAGGQAGADAGGTGASAGAGGVAGSSAAGGSSGADAGGGSGGVAGTGGTGGSSGAGGASVDAGSDACTLTTYYQDNDKDGYGGTTTVQACSPPSSGTWVTQGGDCDDSNADVHPGQTQYFTTGYTPPGSSQLSFDYNCDGSETESGSNSHLSCHWSGIICVGGGYLPVSPSRSGSGVDNYCGSSQQAGCWPNLSGECKAGKGYSATTIACH